jgi:5-methylcytosine-specific restriction endonuclease McrA
MPKQFREINKECENCGRTLKLICGEEIERLCVHHIDRNRFNNQLNNLMVVCYNCHWAIHHEKPLLVG